MDLTYKMKNIEQPATPLLEVIMSAEIYQRVKIQVKVLHVEDSTHINNINLQKVTVIDQSELPKQLTCFDKAVGLLKLGEFYSISNIMVDAYDGERILKTTEASKIVPIEPFELTVPENVDVATSTGQSLVGTVIMLDLSTFGKHYVCPRCEQELFPDDSFLSCNACHLITTHNEALEVSNVSITIKLDNKSKVIMKCPHAILSMVSAKKEPLQIAKSLLNKVVKIIHKNNVIQEMSLA